MRRLLGTAALLFICALTGSAQRADLSGLKFCIDPGHGGHNPANDRYLVPDPGVEFWESESNFQKAMRLDTLLQARGAWVILTRYTNDYPGDDEPSLSARWQLANANNVNWFHSIHSNAFNGAVNYTLVLVKEDQTTRQAVFPQAVTMSNLIGPAITAKLRDQARSVYTYLDYTFYGGTNGGFNLGVLNGLAMPGELSEGSFHDFFPETRRLMNNAYRKMEAYGIRNAFMQYFGVPADTMGIVAGIQTDLATGKPVNLTRVRLLPGDRVSTGDACNNGFYMFDNLLPGTYTIRFETPGFAPDSVQVTVATGATLFADRTLVSFASPTVVISTPADNDPGFPASQPVVMTFSTPMDTASVRRAFSIIPAVKGSFLWANSNTRLTFDPDSLLPSPVAFTITIDTSAHAAGGLVLDGNGDGLSGDRFQLRFVTRYVDVFPPVIISRYPPAGSTQRAPSPLISLTFDEPLNPASVISGNFMTLLVGGSLQSRTLEYAEANGRGGVMMYFPNGVIPGSTYRTRVAGATDQAGNAIPVATAPLVDFLVAQGTFLTTTVDSLNPGGISLLQPSAGTETVGAESVRVEPSSVRAIGTVVPNAGSVMVRYSWDTTAAAWLIRVPMDTAGTPGRMRWRKANRILRAAVYGDGGSGQIRLSLGDGPQREANLWKTIDWVGWRVMDWDLEVDTLSSSSGNGVLDGELRFDAVELRYIPGVSKHTGQLYIDQLELIEKGTTSAGSGTIDMPASFALHPNFPNPFNPSTHLTYDLAMGGTVRLTIFDLLGREVRRVVDGPQAPGRHVAEWDGRGAVSTAASGMYIARLTVVGEDGALAYAASIKLLMMK